MYVGTGTERESGLYGFIQDVRGFLQFQLTSLVAILIRYQLIVVIAKEVTHAEQEIKRAGFFVDLVYFCE